MKSITYSPAAETLLSKLEDFEVVKLDPMEVLSAIELESWGEIYINVKNGTWYISKKGQQ